MKYILLLVTFTFAACNQTATPPPETIDEPYDLDLDSALEELEMVDEE
ncbi:hypothetical protein KA119_00980 [Candidatus Gracilibacteria bacterium]|nr:hypothetical protein [Candidatus Gracilibacteria bacterium]